MEKILSQHRWDRLPVNTFARLYQYVDGRELILHVVRVAGGGRQQMGDTALLGETEWRDAFNTSDVAFALHVPAVEHLTIGEVIQRLHRLGPWSEVEIACGTRRCTPVALNSGEGTAVLDVQPIDYTGRPVTSGSLMARLSVQTIRDPDGSAHTTDDTLLSVRLDGIELAVTEVRQEDGSTIITATALDAMAAEPAEAGA